MKSLLLSAFALVPFLAAPAAADERAFLGVSVAPAEEGDGLRIQEITDDSAAEKAGFEEGDVILEFDGKRPADFESLAGAVRAHKPGDKVAVRYRRGGEEKTVEVTLGKVSTEESPEMAGEEEREQAPEAKAHEEEEGGAWLGVRLEEDEEGNVEIAEVLSGSPAKRVGLKKGDRIVLFKGKPGSEIHETIASSKPKEQVEIKVKRGDEEKEFVVVLEKKKATVVRVAPRIAIPSLPRRPLRVEPLLVPRIQVPEVAPAAPRFERDDERITELLEEVRALRKEFVELRKQVEKIVRER